MRQSLSSTEPPRDPRQRSWYDMTAIVERLAFMQPFGVASLGELRTLLAVAEAGGAITMEDLCIRAGAGLSFTKTHVEHLCDATRLSSGVTTLSLDGETVTLTESGLYACREWNKPLRPVNAKLGENQEPEEVKPDED